MRKAMDYEVTVSRLEIQPIMSKYWAGKEYNWWCWASGHNFDFTSNECTINKHKQIELGIYPKALHRGELLFRYKDVGVFTSDIDKICNEIDIDGYKVVKCDVRLRPRHTSDVDRKMIQLVKNLIDDYLEYGDDAPTLAVHAEYYSSGEYLEMVRNDCYGMGCHGINNMFEDCIYVLDSLDSERFDDVVHRMGDDVYNGWFDFIRKCGLDKNNVNDQIRDGYYAANHEKIFTHDELVRLYKKDGKDDDQAKKTVDNMLLKADEGHWRKFSDLYTYDEVQAEISAIKTALKTFITQ